MRIRVLSVAISLVLHALILAILTPAKKDGTGNAEGDTEEQGEGTFISFEPAEILDKPPPQTTVEGEPCPHWYGGIGINILGAGEYASISDVHRGYAAERAGLQKGDVIVSDYVSIRGEVGKPISVTVMRGDQRITLNLIRERICTDE